MSREYAEERYTPVSLRDDRPESGDPGLEAPFGGRLVLLTL